jgi:competence protein ComEC
VTALRVAFPWAAVAWLAGCAVGSRLARSSPACAVALVAGGVALRSVAGRRLAFAGLGLLAMALAPPVAVSRGFPDPLRPVQALARATGPPRAGLYGWRLPVRIERLRQGTRVELWPESGFVSLPAEPPRGVHRFRVVGYLSRPPGFANGGPMQPGPWRLQVKSLRFLEPLPGGWKGRWQSLSLAARGWIRKELGRQWSGAGGAQSRGSRLARALLLGEAEALPPHLRRALRRFGLAHLVAVSGLHVTLLVGLGGLVGRLLLPRPLRWCAAATAGCGYLLTIGPRPTLLRASGMALLAAAALRSGRPPQALHALGSVALLLGLGDPRGLRQLGLQLTLAATAGILVFGSLLTRLWAGRWGLGGRALAASLGAQLATWPWALPAFHLVAPLAPLCNLLAVPWAGLVLGIAVLRCVLPPWLPWLAPPLVVALDSAAAPLWWSAALPARFACLVPFAHGGLAATALALGAGLVLLRPRAGLAGLCGVLLLARLVVGPGRPRDPELRVLDVGQGEAIVLADGKATVLIDGGGWGSGDAAGVILLPALARAGIRSLDAVALTHPDLDHCGGLAGIVDYLPVAELWTPAGWPAEGCALELLASPGPALRPLWAGERREVGRWRLEALHPAAGARLSGNDRSLVLRAQVLGVRFLLTGDVEAAAEREILDRQADSALRCDVLKLAHHGSRSSTSTAFLAAVAPRLAIASAGRDNRYGHPSRIVRERLAAAGVPLLSTDRHGQILLRILPSGGWRGRGRLVLAG